MIRFQILSIAHIRSQKNYDVLLVNISLRYIELELFNLIYLSMRKKTRSLRLKFVLHLLSNI